MDKSAWPAISNCARDREGSMNSKRNIPAIAYDATTKWRSYEVHFYSRDTARQLTCTLN
jgi:hypothetical protein